MFSNAALAAKYEMTGADHNIIEPKSGYKGKLSNAPSEAVEAMISRKSNLIKVKEQSPPSAKADKA